MCGIAGIFHLETAKPVDPARVRAMLDAMPHRGPDGSGVWTAPGVGLGHLRLSIIDLAGGAQPMLTEDESLAVVFNGEIYNTGELAARWLDGVSLRTTSDTEVLLEAFERRGLEVLSEINGMFAVAIWCRETGTVHLARE